MRRLDDWALVPPADMAALYQREHERWARELDWDTTATWDDLERARRSGRVPGFVARETSGAIAGWTFYLLHGSELQIGALAATSATVTETLLDGVLASPAATVAGRALFHAYTTAPGVTAALCDRGFAIDAQLYLARRLNAGSAGGDASGAEASRDAPRPWRHGDAELASATLRAAYGGPDPRRTFVSSGTFAEWREYVRALTTGDGCGTFQPALTRLAAGADGSVAGVALVTAVSPGCAHLAQLAVDPGAAHAGLGRRLLTEVERATAAAGYRRLSLLVSEDNWRARRLYEASGFTVQGQFAGATRARQRVPRVGLPAA